MITLAKRPGERGFTLIETMWALLIFSMVTLAIVPLLAGSIQGATKSRSYTVGKNVAQEVMERVRGLPYFVSYGAQNRRVDVLDLYYPAYVAAGKYTTTCTQATTSQPACPKNLPEDYQVVFEAQFVQPSGVDPTAETYVAAPVPATYAWNSVGKDAPPARLLSLKLTVSWPLADETKSFSLSSLIGDRKFGGERVRGIGEVVYTAQVVTSFVNTTTGQRDDLVATAGSATTSIETRSLSDAEQSVTTGSIDLVRQPTDTTSSVILADVDGASANLHAPPDADPAAGSTSAVAQVTHPDFNILAALLGPSTVGDLGVKVVNELPIGHGSFGLTAGTGTIEFLVNNQADTSSSTNYQQLLLTPDYPLFSIRSAGGDTLSGSSTGTTEALSSGSRRVETTASADFGSLRLFPVSYIVGTTRSVVVIDDFEADVECDARASGSSIADATWDADLYYWAEFNPNDNLTSGRYVHVPLPGPTAGVDPLDSITADNPLVYEGPGVSDAGNGKDVYLFPVRHEIGDLGPGGKAHGEPHDHAGYLTSWDSVDTPYESVTDSGRVTAARIDGAIQITTAPTNPLIPQSGLGISIGKLGCEAVDKR